MAKKKVKCLNYKLKLLIKLENSDRLTYFIVFHFTFFFNKLFNFKCFFFFACLSYSFDLVELKIFFKTYKN